uniref:Uncharacterized protein n=1 Tax=Romanomermis culicivorax TaxID=13658 RepID=A0A915HQS8_ROMCU
MLVQIMVQNIQWTDCFEMYCGPCGNGPSFGSINAKDTISAHLKYQSGTGGGPAPPELKETVKEIWDMLPGQFERIPNEYDDDAGLLTGTEILPLS